ncbi:MAG: 1-acyl-sn-glycerol-3-phosphate acyltransferase [Spirochaetales bacterium]|nr:1-acyl-sn-glycerol-3-phosphate acyltransferase [Spirochaetales bacterium]
MIALMSIFTWFEIVLCFVLFIPFQIILFILTALFDKRRRIMHFHSGLWCWLALALSPLWHVKISGRENLDYNKSHVVIMNHQSLIDILIAFRLFYPVKMIGKKVLAFVPIVGWNLFLSGHLLVDRKNLKSQMNAIRRMEKIIGSGDSLLVFPEGTRTKDGNLLDFKKGAFRSASSTGTPLLPVVIDGPYQILPRKGFIVNGRRDIIIRIMPPIPVEKGTSPAELAKSSREVMADELEKIRKE